MKGLIVVSHLNSSRTLKGCLDSLVNQNYKNYRIIVVDAGSTDGSIEIAKTYSDRAFLITFPKISEANGQNLGVSFARLNFKFDVILFTNSDCYVPQDWVSKHIKWHERGYDLVGGKLFWGGDEYGFSWSYWTPALPNNILTSGLSLGFSNCSISRKLFESVGPLKEMKAQQDMDFWIRATKAGAKLVLDPKIEVYHDHPMKSFKGSFLRSFYYARNHVLLLREAWGRGHWPNYASWPYSLYTLEELMLIRGTKIWKQQRQTASNHGINPSLPRFLFYRLFASKIPTLLGWIWGLANPVQKVMVAKMVDAHKWGK